MHSPAAEKAAHSQITRGTLEAPIRYLADDLLEGRGPATRGDELARLYLASELQGLGYQPAFQEAGKPSWQQPIDVVGIETKAPQTWSFTGKAGAVDLKWYEDYIGARRRAGADCWLQGCRGRVRRLRHRGARVQVGRLQGRRCEGQGRDDAQQRPGLGSEDLRGQDAASITAGGSTNTRALRDMARRA